MRKYRRFIERKRNEYKKYQSVFSPALKELIVFNAKGFNHLMVKGNGVQRNINDQIHKCNLISLVGLVIKNAKVIEEKRFIKKIKNVECVALAHTFANGKKIRVIVRRIGMGKSYHFWSVMRIN